MKLIRIILICFGALLLVLAFVFPFLLRLFDNDGDDSADDDKSGDVVDATQTQQTVT